MKINIKQGKTQQKPGDAALKSIQTIAQSAIVGGNWVGPWNKYVRFRTFVVSLDLNVK